METSSARNDTSLIDQMTSAITIDNRVAALEAKVHSLIRLVRELLPSVNDAAILPITGRAGGRARAQSAWRWDDGTFMTDADKLELQEEARQQAYERHAAGGRARASRAHRGASGKFKTKVLL